MYRVDSKHLLADTDNQIVQSTCLPGWGFFQFGKEEHKDLWAPDAWETWPHMALATDQGPSDVCAKHALQYKFGVSVTHWSDLAHGANKDLQLAVKRAGLGDWLIVFAIHANLLHGPQQKDDTRYRQMKEAMREAYTCLDENTPLFQEHALAAKLDIDNWGGVSFLGEKPPDTEVWEFAKKKELMTRKGYRMNFNRFQRTVERAKEVRPLWALDAWERSYLCLEADMMTGKGMKQLCIMPGSAEAVPDGGASTGKKHTVDDKSFRGCLSNAVVVSTLFLLDVANKKRLSIFLEIGGPIQKWHGMQSRELRSVDATIPFLLKQVVGAEFFAPLNEIVGSLSKLCALERAEFTIPPPGGCIANENDKVSQDDELAQEFGTMSFSLVFQREIRCLDILVGWPKRMVGVLAEDVSEASRTLIVLIV